MAESCSLNKVLTVKEVFTQTNLETVSNIKKCASEINSIKLHKM